MARPASHATVLALIRALPSVEVHNRLMRVTDRDVALAILHMADSDAAWLLHFLGETKAARVRAEYARIARARFVPEQRAAALRVVEAALRGERAVAGTRSYFRPARD